MLTREQIQDMEDPQDMERAVTLLVFPKKSRNDVPPTGSTGGNGGWSGNGGDDACEFVSVNLSAYQDGELDSDSLRLVLSHLTHCPHCAAELDALQEMDETLEREWRDCAPLPSSSQFKSSIDAIMDSLPAAAEAPKAFAPKRVHARVRWTRFASGVAGLFAFGSLLWTSYRLGYQQGQQSGSMPSSLPAPSNPNANPENQIASAAYFTLNPMPARNSHFSTVRPAPLFCLPVTLHRNEHP